MLDRKSDHMVKDGDPDVTDTTASPFDAFLAKRKIGLTEAASQCQMPQSTLSTALKPSPRGPSMSTVGLFAKGFGLTKAQALELFEAEHEWRRQKEAIPSGAADAPTG